MVAMEKWPTMAVCVCDHHNVSVSVCMCVRAYVLLVYHLAKTFKIFACYHPMEDR